MYRVHIVLFEKFETLDVFGPVQVLGSIPEVFTLNFISCKGGLISSTQGARVETTTYQSTEDMKNILFIPGGAGMMEMIGNSEFISLIDRIAEESEYILTVCTGSALLAKTGRLNGKKATTNKRLFSLLSKKLPMVEWVKQARWVADGNTYTSSGVSAGIDMSLAFVEDLIGREKALDISNRMEYIRNEDREYDPFSKLNGL